jgi:hypothetical protein
MQGIDSIRLMAQRLRAARAAERRLGLVLLLVLAACSCMRLPKSQPKAEVKSLQPNAAATSVTPTALQAEAMRFADEYSMQVAQAADDFAARIGTFEARQFAARIKLGQATAAVIDAAGPSAVVNALDLVVLASVSRMVAQDYLVGERFGADALPLLETSRKVETNAWQLVRHVLKPEQQQELRDLLQEWRRKNPAQHYVGAVRFREFAENIGATPQQSGFKPSSVFSLLFLDPMAGLDPTLRAVEETRYLAERALYYGQRVPILISWQVEYLALQLADQPAAKQMLTNANQVSDSLQKFARLSEQFPQLVNQEREAAIRQLLSGLAAERSNIVASLVSDEIKARELLAETRGTLVAANETAASVNSAVQSLESFVRYVSPPKTNVTAEPAKTNRRPFDVLDYGVAAGQLAGMARDINLLLTSVNHSLPQAAQLGAQAAARVESAGWQAFWLGLVLVLVLLAGGVLAALAYRVLVEKLVRPNSAPTAGAVKRNEIASDASNSAR